MMLTTQAARSGLAFEPHAQTTSQYSRAKVHRQSSLSGPTGSGWDQRAAGSAERNAYRLATARPLQSQSFAKPRHRRMVGSSSCASAVLGLSITNSAVDF